MLYEEILYLQHFFKGKWVIENVISWYNPLVKAYESENHYFWSNFHISKRNKIERKISTEVTINKWGFNLTNYNIPKRLKDKVLNNLVNPKLGLHIWNCAFKEKQMRLIQSKKR
jgi:DNA (cytosine-5)-methyltransferase 1